MVRRLAGALALVTVLAGCIGSDDDAGTERAAGPSESSSPTSSTTHSGYRERPGAPELDRSVVRDLEAVRRAHPDAEVSVGVAPVGEGEEPQVVGDAPTLVAWSTIKVPVALAVIDAGQSHPNDIDAALTISDNEAAKRLWESLGPGPEAARSVEQQLRRTGDDRTRVPGEVTSPGHSAPGQTMWRLPDQTTFAAQLPCRPGSSTITDAMGRIADEQRWGLGQIEGTHFKGGWGETPDGYVVRQLGVVPGSKGEETAVTLQVRTGTHEQGTAIADAVADVVREHEGDLPTGSCA